MRITRITDLFSLGVAAAAALVAGAAGCNKADQKAASTPPPKSAPSAPAAPAAGSPADPGAPADVKAAPADAEKTPSGLASKVLKAGTGTEKPAATDKVTVHYTGWTTNGQKFDSSVDRGQPATFPLNGVIKGWTEGVQLMVQGEKRRFWIPAEMAYGENPGGGRPGGMLVFDVELLGVTKTPPPPSTPEDVAAPPATAKKTKSGISYRVLKKGTGKVHPKPESMVVVHYTGWTEGVQLMVAGEKTRFWIPSKLAYGDNPASGAPAGTLVFDIELAEIK